MAALKWLVVLLFGVFSTGFLTSFSAANPPKSLEKKKKASSKPAAPFLSAEEKKLEPGERIVLMAEKVRSFRQKQITVKGRTIALDCSGFVRAVYLEALNIDLFEEAITLGVFSRLSSSPGFEGSKGALALFISFKLKERIRHTPRPGDVVFFDNTYDKNRNGKRDDPLTHVGIVSQIDEEGTVTFIHGGTSRGVLRETLNLKYPHLEILNGKRINSHLQRPMKGQKKPLRLSGELARAFGGF